MREVFDDVTSLFRRWHLHVTHPRYFGLFNPSVTLGSIVGDSLAALYNPQLAVWSHSPIANEIERHTLRWLMSQIGLDPEEAHANFTSGGAEANFTATVVALTDRLPGFVQRGLEGRRVSIYVSEEAHHSFHKTAVMAGLGSDAIRTVAVDGELRLDVDALRRRIEEDRREGWIPALVVGTAGTTSAGAIDPLPEIAALCRDQELWFHVDAAWGGSALLVPELREHLAGVELSDSLTWDAHKWLSVPMGAGMFFTRHREPVLEAFGTRTSYMPGREEDQIDPYASTVQWSRRTIGLKLFLSLATLGLPGYQEMIRHQVAMSRLLADRLRSEGWRVIHESPLAVVCFTHPSLPDAAAVEELARRIQQQGDCWISATRLAGEIPALRACVTSFRTDVKDIEALLALLQREIG